jgi:hypothetical protein
VFFLLTRKKKKIEIVMVVCRLGINMFSREFTMSQGTAAAADPRKERFCQNFKAKRIPCSLRTTQNAGRNARMVGFFFDKVPATKQGFGDKTQLRFTFQVVTCIVEGFSSAPIVAGKDGKGRAGDGARKLSTMKRYQALEAGLDSSVGSIDLYELECMPYTIIQGKPQLKGETQPTHSFCVSVTLSQTVS